MSSSIDHYRADLALRLSQGPIRSSPFEYRRPSLAASEGPDYRARPMPSRAAPRTESARPHDTTLSSSTIAPAIAVPAGARKGVEADAERASGSARSAVGGS
jgi:hypothetical protein